MKVPFEKTAEYRRRVGSVRKDVGTRVNFSGVKTVWNRIKNSRGPPSPDSVLGTLMGLVCKGKKTGREPLPVVFLRTVPTR